MDTALNEDDDSSTSALSIRVSVPSRVTKALYTFLSEFPSVKSNSVIAAMFAKPSSRRVQLSRDDIL